MQQGLVPDNMVQEFDMDRLYELDEDFLATNTIHPLALK